jgi:RHH-type proline utilization regulon transcriptional repressor/proline dehydrogenase/delta 1-pyrroline-5-carboxylate dehydrogenase
MCLAEALLRIPDKHTADVLLTDQLGWRPPLMRSVIKIMARQFVMAETIESALHKAAKTNQLYSFDMLGEAARTEKDALAYLDSYTKAIHAVGKGSNQISIKLSALYPRYEVLQWKTGFPILYERIKQLAILAKSYNIGMTLDAEESDRLEYQLALFEKLMQDESLSGWDGLGIAVQAYQKRAKSVIERLSTWTKQYNRKIMVRLVKGAYWDTEIKRAQVLGLSDYPVYTQKSQTDESYLACAALLMRCTDTIYPQFATHNSETLSKLSIPFNAPFEIQRLYGMGQSEHAAITTTTNISSRIYAPIGTYEQLLPYLIRRLIENGANTSFLKQKRHPHISITPSKTIPLPRNLFEPFRQNSQGVDVTDLATLKEIEASVDAYISKMPLFTVQKASAQDISSQFDAAQKTFEIWSKRSVSDRAKILRRAADLLEEKRHLFYALLIKEAGKTISNAVGEVREAVDYCRYYAVQAEKLMNEPVTFPGPTGESNQMTYSARGVMACISPWNFPLAIFAGQIMGALSVGNTVLAKPAHQTPQIAMATVSLFHEAGVPKDVLQLMIADRRSITELVLNDPRLSGVLFTGSTDTARQINQTLANKPGPIIPFLAETGGQNAMIADSTALLEQLVIDVMQSAFDSAGQRCSALRVLFIQDDIADSFITMLKGSMDLLKVGDPVNVDTDIGPVIDADAQSVLNNYIDTLKSGKAKWVYSSVGAAHEAPVSNTLHFVYPTICEIDNLNVLEGEVFGPILHIIRFKATALDEVINAINKTGYGLTFGIESRIEGRYKAVSDVIDAGNIYVNRNMIGAVVGVQPFGGQGLSGTGPKAGGPNYLNRLVHERVVSVNMASIGGNLELLSS